MSDAQEIEELEDEIVRLRAALETVKAYLPPAEESVYGHYLGGDPRDFTPDRDCCTEAEIQAWGAACLAANAGQPCPEGVESHGHYVNFVERDGKREMVLESRPGSFGIGARITRDPELAKIHAIIDEALKP